MQRVVRSTFAALVLAGLAACGDKVNVVSVDTTTKVNTDVTAVTVVPANVQLQVGQTASLSASVTAGAGVTDRTVTWSSTNTGVATVAAAGVVTAVAPGTVAIVAKSNANPNVTGAAAVTVTAPTPVAVTVATINVTKCDIFGGCTSVPANLANVGTSNPNETGQVDVTLNVDIPAGTSLRSITGILKCGTDSIVQTQAVANLAPTAAEEAAAPVTFSFNTAAFNPATGGVGGSANPNTVRNGQCTVRAIATTTAGTQSASLATQFTLNNLDIVVGNVRITKEAVDPLTLVWYGGDVQVQPLPVFYSGRTAASVFVGLFAPVASVGNPPTGSFTGPAIGAPGPFATPLVQTTAGQSVTFPNDPTSPLSVAAVTSAAVFPQVAVVDNQGNVFGAFTRITYISTTPATTITPAAQPAPFRLDNQAPLPGALSLSNNVAQATGAMVGPGSANGAYVSGTFAFANTVAAGYCGPNSTGFTPANTGTAAAVCAVDAAQLNNLDARGGIPGVDKVTVVFQSATTATGTFTNITSAGALAESNTATTNVIRMITTDALGNADTSFVNGVPFVASNTTAAANPTRFGVDKTAPTIVQNTVIASPAVYTVIGGAPPYNFTISDNLSGVSLDAANGNIPRALVAVTHNWVGTGGTGGLANTDPSVYENRTYTNTGTAGTFPVSQSLTDLSPCAVGRFNASQSKAGPGALPAFAPSGTQLGWCTPVFYDILGGNLASDLANTAGGGQFLTEVIAIDEAGNRATAFTNLVVEDATIPTVTAVDLPGTFTGNTNVTLSASATDNVDLAGSFATVGYTAAGMTLRYPTTTGPGVPFDNTLTRSATINPVITTFIRNLQVAPGGVPAQGNVSANNATNVTVCAIDEANQAISPGALPAPLGPGCNGPITLAPAISVGGGSSTSWSTAFTGGVTLTANNNPITNCPAAGCGPSGTTAPVNPTSTTLSMAASGLTGLFNNPFVVVSYWYLNTTTGQWVQFGSQTSASVTDTGIGNGRTWTYSFTWDPPVTGPDGFPLAPANGGSIVLSIRAIGVNSNGDGVASSTYSLTLTNP